MPSLGVPISRNLHIQLYRSPLNHVLWFLWRFHCIDVIEIRLGKPCEYVIGQKGYDLRLVEWVKNPIKICLLQDSSWSLCVALLPPGNEGWLFRNKEGLMTYYWTRVGQIYFLPFFLPLSPSLSPFYPSPTLSLFYSELQKARGNGRLECLGPIVEEEKF